MPCHKTGSACRALSSPICSIPLLGLGALAFLFVPLSWALKLLAQDALTGMKLRLGYWLGATAVTAAFFSSLPQPNAWPVPAGLGGQAGDVFAGGLISLLSLGLPAVLAGLIIGLLTLVGSALLILRAVDMSRDSARELLGNARSGTGHAVSRSLHRIAAIDLSGIKLPFGKSATQSGKSMRPSAGVEDDESDPVGSITPFKGISRSKGRIEPELLEENQQEAEEEIEGEDEPAAPVARKMPAAPKTRKAKSVDAFELPDLDLLAEPKKTARGADLSADQLEENARALEGVLDDFGVKGQIVAVKPGPVVTLV